MRYDAIIVGTSFAGLAVANRLRGRVLLIDAYGIGEHQTSACSTLLSVPLAWDASESVLQVYQRGYIHTASEAIVYDLLYPFCTIDYRRFCQAIARRVEAEVVCARVLGLADGHVMTTHGEFEGDCLIDASGWQAVLAKASSPAFADSPAVSSGLGTVTPCGERGLHFWVDPTLLKNGVAWLFPCGTSAQIGVGSYKKKTPLKPELMEFAARNNLQVNGLQGGFFPCRLRQATVGKLFLVGDAAGQCVPLTGEGIRPALFFGQRCGDIVQAVIERRITLDQGLAQYRRLVESYRRYYWFLEQAQHWLPALPDALLRQFLSLASWTPLCHKLLRGYDRLFPLPSQQQEGMR